MKKAHIVTHTHWDREWRYPIWENRQYLVDMMDELLEILDTQPEYSCFLMDGQTVMVTDYLEMRPEMTDKVKSYIKEGRIDIGPWYTLPDLYPVCGESLVRNLLAGDRSAKRLGRRLDVAHESFGWGQTAQLPQIYKGFGLDFVVVAKNVSKDRCPDCEFIWEAPDGSRVYATRLGDHARANFFMNAFLVITTDKDYNSDEYLLGWMFLFGNQYIIVEPPNNIYELKGPNVRISSGTQIIPCADTEMQVDFVINTINAQDVSRMARRKIYRRINGQYINTFKSDEDIYKTLWYRYYIDYYDEGGNDSESNYYTQIISVLTMDIEAEPGAIIQARSDAEGVTGLSTFIVNETGRYFLDPGSEEYSIVECYIKGMRIDARYLLNKGDARNFDDMNNTGTGMSIETWNQIHDLGSSAAAVPVEYDYYTADGKSYMFYRGKWYPVTIQQINGINTIFDVDCPVDAIIYYYILAVKGIY